jgi:hypothetical protein
MRKMSRKPEPGFTRRVFGANDRGYRKIQSALVELDKVAVAAEARWGLDRLPDLVTPELREKFHAQGDKLDAAMMMQDADAVEHEAAVMIRAWNALERAARAAGAREVSGAYWGAKMADGRLLAVCETIHDARKAAADNPDAVVLAVSEIAALWPHFESRGVIEKAKVAFPGAEVKKAGKVPNDAIPF